jgi:hypothetical protein
MADFFHKFRTFDYINTEDRQNAELLKQWFARIYLIWAPAKADTRHSTNNSFLGNGHSLKVRGATPDHNRIQYMTLDI